MDKSETLITLNTQDTGRRQQNRKKNNETPDTENQKRSATWASHKRGLTQVFVKGKQVLPLIRHPQCYAYSKDVLENTMRKQTNNTHKKTRKT